ncbi:hypothetical protein C9374_002831 [Naegleria lovaniensis]|uniref:Uncharacterized protein n=1 Tax=Naegleria lovaniensis TaxID=51637 RepID=A0AA88GT43_NAELO|nr:uncharacterized protein C9374_002831 [Naegleria lovaniensis]KAG2386385.1 hypothetical protein C9374_002831 [Naegleria lovaniensis]
MTQNQLLSSSSSHMKSALAFFYLFVSILCCFLMLALPIIHGQTISENKPCKDRMSDATCLFIPATIDESRDDQGSVISFRNGRFLRKNNDSGIEFDWSGVIISTQIVYTENSSLHSANAVLKTLVHMKDVGNLYNIYLWRVSNTVQKQFLQKLTLVTNHDNNNVGYGVEFSWSRVGGLTTYTLEIEIEKRTEAMLGVATFYGFSFVKSENFVLSPVNSHQKTQHLLQSKSTMIQTNSPLKIEFIGDSITCAYGNLGKPPCAYTPNTQDVHESFVEKTARYLGASEIHVECWSGKGVVRNYADKNTTSKDPFPVYYPRTLANNPNVNWDFKTSNFIPDIVVITLGTNDFSTPPRPSYEEFSTGYQHFIDFIMSKYLPLKGPSFKLVLVSVVVTENYGEFIKKVAQSQPSYGKTVHFASLEDVWRNFQTNDWGCSGHPSVSGDEKMAKALSAFISTHVIGQ